MGMHHGTLTGRHARIRAFLVTVAILPACQSQTNLSDTSTCDDVPIAGAGADTLVVEGGEGACTVVFDEVVLLQGSIAGELPRLPVSSGPDGGWVTATYDPGRVALWSANGRFRRVIGKGEGGGPGEFIKVSDIVVDAERDRIYIFTVSNRIEVYDEEGKYLETISLPRYSSTGTLMPDGSLIAVLSRAMGEPAFAVVRPDTVVRWGYSQRGPVFPPLLYGNGENVWTAESAWYEIRRHASDGRVIGSIKRETPDFPEPTKVEVERGAGPLLVAFTVDTDKRRVFALLKQVMKPGHTPPAAVEAETRLPPADADQDAYYAGVIEAFDFSGNVLASLRIREGENVPYPIMSSGSSGLWYEVLDDDLRSIRILRPRLEAR